FLPQLYADRHVYQFANNLMTLQMFQSAFNRAPDAQQQFLDLGCGTGDFTLQELLPRSQTCRRIVAVDSSPQMVQFAENNFSHPQVIYDLLDIRNDVSEFVKKYGRFERLYSFNVLHWVKDQYTAFKNISDLMTPDGECLLTFAARLPSYDIWRRMVNMDRWKTFSELIESFIPPTNDMADRAALISHILNVLKHAGLTPRTCEVMRITQSATNIDKII
ncbi:unnamed protein product, partial [Ixodes hexagonus]